MNEGKMHALIKSELSESFTRLGYKTEKEKDFEFGIADLIVSKGGSTFVIEVIDTHRPNWFGVQIKQDHIYVQPISRGDRYEHLNLIMQKSNIKKLDRIRGDVSRSTFLSKLVKEAKN